MKDATYIKRLVHKKTTPDRSFWMSESVPVLGGTLTNDMKTIKLVWHIDKKSFIWDGCNNADDKKCTTFDPLRNRTFVPLFTISLDRIQVFFYLL